MPGGSGYCRSNYVKRLIRACSSPTLVNQVLAPWSWPIDPSAYDRCTRLRRDERKELAYIAGRPHPWTRLPQRSKETLIRLLRPWNDIMLAVDPPKQPQAGAITILLAEMHERQRPFWVWKRNDWLEIFRTSTKDFVIRYPHSNSQSRQLLVSGAYLLHLFQDFRSLGLIDRSALAGRIFGRSRIESAIEEVVRTIRSWGYSEYQAKQVQWVLCTVLLANKSPRLEDLTVELLEDEKRLMTVRHRRSHILVLSKALAALGYIPNDLSATWRVGSMKNVGSATNGVAPEWVRWVDRWYATSTLQEHCRRRYRLILLKAGRWVTELHPDYVTPDCWTRELAAEWVATVCHMKIGEWTQRSDGSVKKVGHLLSARARAHHLSSVSTFFRDCQEWEWISRRFDPRRCFAAPRSLRALIGPKPRVHLR